MRNCCCRYFTALDQLGEPVSVKFRGRDTFKTPLGSVMTIIGSLLVIGYLVVRIQDWPNVKPELVSARVNNDLAKVGEINAADHGFGLAITFRNKSDGEVQPYDDTFLHLEVE